MNQRSEPAEASAKTEEGAGATRSVAATLGVDAKPNTGSEPGERGRVALLGNPNTGKTTLFNRLTGLRHKTSNFAGTTVEARVGLANFPGVQGLATRAVEVVDLPGIYSLELEQIEAMICREVLAGRIAAKGDALAEPDAVCVVLDATNLPRNLLLAGEVLRRRLPTVVAVNMIDLARAGGMDVDCATLERSLGCPVVAISARSGEGVAGQAGLTSKLLDVMASGVVPTVTPPGDAEGLKRWADQAFARCNLQLRESRSTGQATPHRVGLLSASQSRTDRIDRVVTHPVVGPMIFTLVMAGLFFALFSLAKVPMELLGKIFEFVGGFVGSVLPEGLLSDLIVHGVIAGAGATVIFLPQILLLFFLITLLEDTGYLSRGAFLMDRLLRPFGLPGHAFVPLLSSHACALPGIMSARTIPDPKERLATILVAPFMTCSARLPVYVLLTGLLFPDSALLAAVAFIACYALGIIAGVLSALVARRTILRGRARPLAIELPSYKLPSVKTALLGTYDRGIVFLKKAGTSILAICIVLWWLGSFPRVAPPEEAVAMRTLAAQMAAAPTVDPPLGATEEPLTASELLAKADRLEQSHAKSASFIGMLGRTLQPVLSPIGVDWKLTVGIVASFAAREVFVGTMSVMIAGTAEEDGVALREKLSGALRDDGKTLIFNRATCWSLLVFYVLAMQCLPTLAVTARESGHVKWAVLQLVWMSGVAFTLAAIVYQIAK